MRYVWVLAALGALLLGGCSNVPAPAACGTHGHSAQKPASTSYANPASDSDNAMRDILGMMDEAVAPEPSGDVSHGLFLGRITRIETSGTPALVVDFVTPEMQPGVTKAQREKSSWPDYFGYNRVAHPQRLQAGAATLITGDLRFEPVTFAGFVREYRSYQGSDSMNYYFLLSDGKIDAVWPWQY